MTKKLSLFLMLLVPFIPITNYAANRLNIQPGILNYSCKGARVSGALQIRNYGTLKGHYLPSYNTTTEFWVNGNPYRWSIKNATVRPWKKSVAFAPKGTWEADFTKLVYTLGGRQDNFDGWYASFHVQVNNQKWNKLKGYLGYQDAEKAEVGAREAAKYNFTCQLTK